jgi:hypothetical protein
MGHDNQQDIQAYIHCMEEIKRRISVVGRVLSGETNTGYVITNAELLAVQLRKVAELIALSTICSHREEYERIRDDFERDWKARLILRDVERINPNFYPKPTRQVKDPETGEIVRAENVKDGYLTREELVDMVDECSALLHATNPYQDNTADPKEFIGRCKKWRDEILTLLNHHQVQLVDSNSQWWVLMQGKSDGRVHVAEMQEVGEP